MFICHLLLALVGFLSVRGLTQVEDKVLTRRLLDYFEEVLNHDDAVVVNREKREALVDVLEHTIPSLFALRHFTLNHHYWTRKRGSDRSSFENATNMNNISFRKKRAILEKLLKDKVQLRSLNSNSTEHNSTSKRHHAKGKRSLGDLTEVYEMPMNEDSDQSHYKIKRQTNRYNETLISQQNTTVTATFTSNLPTKPTPKKTSDSQEIRNNMNYRKRL